MDIRDKIALLPHQSGVYRYYDSAGNVIYVGKAKDLAKRVAQYFVDPSRLNAKTRVLVSKIADAQYSVVSTEADALLLRAQEIPALPPYDAVVPLRFAPLAASERFDERAGLVRRLADNVAQVDAALAITSPAGQGHRLIERMEILPTLP